MNIFKGRLPQFQQEMFSLLYLFTFQTWWSFNFPAFLRLGTPWNTIVGISMTLLAYIMFISIFIFPERHAPSFNLEYLNDCPFKDTMKKIHRGILIALFFATIIYTWYTDYYRMHSVLYILCYAHWIITFTLIIRVIQKYNRRNKNNIAS